jgi:hypothetical protein
MGSPDPVEIAAELRDHAERAALCSAVKTAALSAAERRDSNFLSGAGQSATGGDRTGTDAPEGASPPDASKAETPYGNVATVLSKGAADDRERALIGALLGLAFVDDADGATSAAPQLVWLATHTPFNAFPALDLAITGSERPLYARLGALADAQSAEGGPEFGWPEAMMAAALLRTSALPGARSEVARLAASAKTPALRLLLRALPSDDEAPRLQGELSPPPKNPLVTTVMALTLVLFAVEAARAIARLVLSYRRPAELSLSPKGLQITQRTELMGRVLRDRSVLVPLNQLARVTREVRFARVGLYAGLVALVLGSYLGMGLFVDGLRVPGGSFSLLSMAVAMVVIGLVLDYGLTSLSDSVRGKCRVIVVPLKGKTLCVGSLDAERTDAVLAKIAESAHG